jgi:hypothetical protein
MCQVSRKEFYIDFFYKHFILIDMFNETLEDLLARHGGNYTALAKALDNIYDRSYLSMLINKKRGKAGKPPIDLVEKIKEKFGIDPMTGRKIGTNVTTKEDTVDFSGIASSFKQAMDLFRMALEENRRQVNVLENDKSVAVERELWYRKHLDELTMRLNTLKQA